MPPTNTPEEGVPAPEADPPPLFQSGLPHQAASISISAPTSPNASVPVSGRTSPAPTSGRPSTSNVFPPISFQELDYVSTIDDVLLCPICKTPFHQPVTTKKCGHTFCIECLHRSCEIQSICPIDREPLRYPGDISLTRIVADQVDRLRVRCPNLGCNHTCTREELPSHYERDCDKTPVRCPDEKCDRFVARIDATPGKGCLHRFTSCKYCEANVIVAELEKHYDTRCKNHTVECQVCGSVVVRHHMPKHRRLDCPEEPLQCKWAQHGCRFHDKRRLVQVHETGCVYQAIGELKANAQEDRRTITDLRGEVASLRKELQRKNSSLAAPFVRPGMSSFIPELDLENNATSPRSMPVSYLNGPSGTGSVWESSDEYLLAQFERMETTYEELRKTQTEMDGRHSMMLLNETMPIKEQLAELRSNLGVIGMHTTWLMNMMRQNRGQQQQRPGAMSVAAAAPSGTNAGGGGAARNHGDDESSGFHALSRRSSDGRSEPPPRL